MPGFLPFYVLICYTVGMAENLQKQFINSLFVKTTVARSSIIVRKEI